MSTLSGNRKVRLTLSLSIDQSWTTRQVYFSYAFFGGTLVENVYLILPPYFHSDTDKDRAKMFMKINKSIFGLVQPSLYWYNYLKGVFEARGFKPIPMDPYMFYVRALIALIYVDDVLFFGPYQDKIDEFIK